MEQKINTLCSGEQARLERWQGQMRQALGYRLAYQEQWLASMAQKPVLRDARAPLNDRQQSLEQAGMRLHAAMQDALQRPLDTISMRLNNGITRRTDAHANALQQLQAPLASLGTHMLDPLRRGLAVQAAQLDSLSPLAVLARGYSITYNADKHVVTSAASVKPGDQLTIKVSDGEILAEARLEKGAKCQRKR
jgi:exodeoxyribonuclease VII large subunit